MQSLLSNNFCWCGGKKARIISTLNFIKGMDIRLIRCIQCGVYSLSPPPDQDDLAMLYNDNYYGSGSGKFITPIAKAVDCFQNGRVQQVAKHIPPDGRILDIGCGNGGFVRKMAKLGYQLEGTEWTKKSANRATDRSQFRIHVGDLLELDLPIKSFDAVTMWHVFEHLQHPFETLKKIHSLLKNNGTLFLSLPNHESWQAHIFGTNWFHLDPPMHLFGYGPNSIKTLLDKTGFILSTTTTFSIEQNPYGFMQSILNTSGFPRDRTYSILKGISHPSLAVKSLDFMLLSLLVIPGFAENFVAGYFGKGATMTLTIKKAPL